MDGDAATSWGTQSYNDQLGPPPGLKTGVGLLLDLDGEQDVVRAVVDAHPGPENVFLGGMPEVRRAIGRIFQDVEDADHHAVVEGDAPRNLTLLRPPLREAAVRIL